MNGSNPKRMYVLEATRSFALAHALRPGSTLAFYAAPDRRLVGSDPVGSIWPVSKERWESAHACIVLRLHACRQAEGQSRGWLLAWSCMRARRSTSH